MSQFSCQFQCQHLCLGWVTLLACFKCCSLAVLFKIVGQQLGAVWKGLLNFICKKILKNYKSKCYKEDWILGCWIIFKVQSGNWVNWCRFGNALGRLLRTGAQSHTFLHSLTFSQGIVNLRQLLECTFLKFQFHLHLDVKFTFLFIWVGCCWVPLKLRENQ